MKLYFLLSLCCLIMLANIVKAQHTSVFTQHNTNTRAGWNNRETTLTTANVNPRQFGLAFSLAVDDQVYSQPLVYADLAINGGTHNVVIIATVNNSIYAYDGDNGTLYWHKNYSPSGQRPPKNTDMTGACGGFYRDFSGNMGIVGTPVIDSATRIMYFVARSTTGSTFVQYLHAINLADGSEAAGSPLKITASCPGNGSGNVNNVVSFDPQRNNQRQALTISNGIVYVSFSSHCDWQPYHGWILGYDKQTLAQKIVYNTTPNGYEAGLWQSGGGPAVDNDGNLYVVTGNGSVGYNGDPTNTINRGESALKLTPSGSTLTVASYFTPSNYQQLEGSDLDYGSMGAFLIPNSNYYITGCKDGVMYLVNKDAMGGYSTSSNNLYQEINLTISRTLRCQPSYFKGMSKEFVYVWSENDQLLAFPFNRNTNMLDVSNQVTGPPSGPTGASGADLSVSSNGSTDGTGIVWAAYAANGDANQSVRPGILRALDANNVGVELWNNQQVPSRDYAGNFAKFAAPTIANGHVYLPTFSNKIAVYGIIDSTSSSCSGTNLALNKPAFSSSNESEAYLPGKAFDGNSTTTRWASQQQSDPQWIYVDLGKIDSICRVTLNWEVALGKNFQIQVSDDAQNWATVATVTNNTDFLNFIDVVAKGRYVRMYGTARGTNYGYSLYEFGVNGKDLSTCPTPDGLSNHDLTTSSATLKWTSTGADSYTFQYRTNTSNQFKTITTTADSVALTGLGCSTSYVWQVRSVCGGSTSDYSNPSTFNTADCIDCGLLPTRVFTADVGNVNIPGQACYTGQSSFNLKGSGNDINNSADQFRFVYKTFADDATVQARISAQDATNPLNKAGVMFRESADSTARNVFIAASSGSGVVFQSRANPAGATTMVNIPGVITPYFLRMVKQGSVYTGYVSPDSIVWTQFLSVANNMDANGPVNGGLAVTSHDNSQVSAAQFDQVGFYAYSDNEVNLALNKPSYGSNYNGLTHTGAYANDGDTTTHWASTPGTDPQWYYVDLGQRFGLHRIYINWNADYANEYQLQVSDDAANWTTIQQLKGNTIRENTFVLNNDTARFIRLYNTKTANNNGYAINELQVFGDTIVNVNADIAKGRPVISSSDAGSGFTAAMAVDTNFTTRWASKPDADPQWLYVDLGAVYDVTNVNIAWELNLAKNFAIQLSNDASNWVTAKSVTNNTSYDNFIPVKGIGRYLRIYGTARGGGGGNYSIYDLQAMGVKDTTLGTADKKLSIDKFNIYPNPSNGHFSIDFESTISQKIQITISDILGNKLRSETLNNFSGTYHYAADMSSSPTGNYIISLRTDKGAISKVVIKL